MLHFNILRICKARGIDRPYSFLRKHGFGVSAATRIANDHILGLSIGNIETLCLLLNCTPNDLLEWTPSKEWVANTSHSLNVLKRQDKWTNVTQLVNGASLEKLEKLEEIIRKELEG